VKTSEKGEMLLLWPFNRERLHFGMEFTNEQWMVFGLGGEAVFWAIAPLWRVDSISL